MKRNKWLLVQLGANNQYFTAAYTNRRTAQEEADRTEKFGIPYAIANLDILFDNLPGDKSLEETEDGEEDDDVTDSDS